MNFIGSMVKSNNVVDKRLITLFRLRHDEHLIDKEFKKAQSQKNAHAEQIGSNDKPLHYWKNTETLISLAAAAERSNET